MSLIFSRQLWCLKLERQRQEEHMRAAQAWLELFVAIRIDILNYGNHSLCIEVQIKNPLGVIR